MLKSNRQNLVLILGMSSLLSLFLSFLRVYISGTVWYIFLIWNLFLSWIPFLCSTLLLKITKKPQTSKVIVGIILFIWFIFFPNAPYIITDLFHLRIYQSVPIWFDVALIFSYVWNGLILGFVSLLDVQSIIERTSKKMYSWVIALGVLVLASFGIYLGRYLRWNSWDIISNPLALFQDILDRIVNPFSYPRTYNMTIVFSLFLITSYITFRFLVKNLKDDK